MADRDPIVERIAARETRWIHEVCRAVEGLASDDLGQQLTDASGVLEAVTAVPADHYDPGLAGQPADQELAVG